MQRSFWEFVSAPFHLLLYFFPAFHGFDCCASPLISYFYFLLFILFLFFNRKGFCNSQLSLRPELYKLVLTFVVSAPSILLLHSSSFSTGCFFFHILEFNDVCYSLHRHSSPPQGSRRQRWAYAASLYYGHLRIFRLFVPLHQYSEACRRGMAGL